MASHVVVIDTAARKHTIKTSPNKTMSDVLQEACSKIGIDPSQYTLKHGNKQLDLSNTIRFSGLSPGAKLTLVQASKSPAVVKVALDIPDIGRAIHPFPSNTTLWQILRRFESGVAGGDATQGKNLNFTQRATPMLSSGSSGAGRMCFEMPVLTSMGRELASFTDLQKTLAQLGMNSGSVAYRLSFRNSEQPLEEAMEQISRYFKEVDEPISKPTNTEAGAHAGGPADLQSAPDVDTAAVSEEVAGAKSPVLDASTALPASTASVTTLADDVIASSSITEPQSVGATPETQTKAPLLPIASSSIELVNVTKPAAYSTPAAARHAVKENEYTPTQTHALLHQARLEKEGRNKRLLSDKEIEDAEAAKAAARAEIKQVEVKVVLPDETSVLFRANQTATIKELYDVVRSVLAGDAAFKLLAIGNSTRREVLPEGPKKLIADLGWRGKISVTMQWAVPPAQKGAPVLRAEYNQHAVEMKVHQTHWEEDADGDVKMGGAAPTENKEKPKLSAEEKESRLRKMMGKSFFGGKK